MSGNAEKAKFTEVQMAAAKADRRILRTRNKLGDALMALIQEKNFEAITVQEVLDRAGVGRATFYTHYRDKNDLFLSDVEDFLRMMSTLLTRTHAVRERVLPVREFFAHLLAVRSFYISLVASGKDRDVMELGREYFARSIEERLQLAAVPGIPAEIKVQSHALSGAFFALMAWWIDHGMETEPEEMDRLFHRMVWSGIGVLAP